MVQVTKTSASAGAWLKKDTLKSGDRLQIVSEATPVEGQNGVQLVVKVRQKGGEALNTAINTTSKNALIDAFGDDTKNWVNQVVTAEVEKAIIAGKRSIILYMVPDGYSVVDGADGFVTIERDEVEAKPARATAKRKVVEEVSEEDTREAPLPDESDAPDDV